MNQTATATGGIVIQPDGRRTYGIGCRTRFRLVQVETEPECRLTDAEVFQALGALHATVHGCRCAMLPLPPGWGLNLGYVPNAPAVGGQA